MMARLPVVYSGDWHHLKKVRRMHKRFAHLETFEIASMDGDCEVAGRGFEAGLKDASPVMLHEGALCRAGC